MRIKEYNWETVSKLKNPIANYQEVMKFIHSGIFKFNSKGEHVETYKIEELSLFIMIDYVVEEVEFIDMSNADLIYRVGNFYMAYIPNKDKFEKLKQFYLKYKLNEHLTKTFNENKPKTKVFKI